MPIEYDPKTHCFEIKNCSPEELLAITEVGKMMLIQGLAGSYTNERFKQHLMFAPKDSYFNG
jgi:hypothetical protein